MIRAALGEEAFKAIWAEGQVLTLEQAVAYALIADKVVLSAAARCAERVSC